jgi:hypothetical protein
MSFLNARMWLFVILIVALAVKPLAGYFKKP